MRDGGRHGRAALLTQKAEQQAPRGGPYRPWPGGSFEALQRMGQSEDPRTDEQTGSEGDAGATILTAVQLGLIQDALIAIALGLLVGLQREWRATAA